jgi:hypothetical protein
MSVSIRIAIIFFLVASVSALGQKSIISFNVTAEGLRLVGNGTTGQILVAENDKWGVIRAAGDLAIDFGKVTGKNFSLSAYNSTSTAPVYTWRAPTSNVNVSCFRSWIIILIGATALYLPMLRFHIVYSGPISKHYRTSLL